MGPEPSLDKATPKAAVDSNGLVLTEHTVGELGCAQCHAIFDDFMLAGFHEKFIPVYLHSIQARKPTGKPVARLFLKRCIVTLRMYQPGFAVYITLGIPMMAWQVLYEGQGLLVGGKPHEFSVFGFVMAKDLRDLDTQVTRVAMQHPLILQHEGDPSLLIFNPHEVYERPDLEVLITEELEIELESN